ncbi:hypothetical protein [Tolypothrix sp. VBCCA 56010]
MKAKIGQRAMGNGLGIKDFFHAPCPIPHAQFPIPNALCWECLD